VGHRMVCRVTGSGQWLERFRALVFRTMGPQGAVAVAYSRPGVAEPAGTRSLGTGEVPEESDQDKET
jgi:hypothetical protein